MKKMEKVLIKEEGLQVQHLERKEMMMIHRMEQLVKEEMEEAVAMQDIVEEVVEMDIMGEVGEAGQFLKRK